MQRIVLAILLLPTLAMGASFDCGKATTRVEQLICANADLSSLDEELARGFLFEMERVKSPDRLKAAQKAWLVKRNDCAEVACIRQQYEQRIIELSCDPKGHLSGSAIGAIQCAAYSRQVLDRELAVIEENYIRSVSADNNNPEYLVRTFDDEKTAWRNYRSAYCGHHGAMEGGSDGWKNAFAAICEVDETRKRISRLKGAIGAK